MSRAKTVLDTLRTWHKMPAGELLQRVNFSRPTLMRAIKELGGQVISRGHARRTAYAARRDIRGISRPFPVYRIDSLGRGHEVALLEPVYPQGSALQFTEAFRWPLDNEMADGWFDSLPYPLDDIRPQGFLGRNFSHRYSSLIQTSEHLRNWSEDDVLYALSLFGVDQNGDYILGEAAFRQYLDAQQKGFHFFSDDEITTAYPEQAVAALRFGLTGSSTAGEFPKFTAPRLVNGKPVHVIVKFSGEKKSPQEERWADLLVCEHLAANTIVDTLNISAVQSRIYQIARRTFYETVRFDRHGEFGRKGVCSWAAMNSALFGLTGPWPDGADIMQARNVISSDTCTHIHLLWHFGSLIANTDMHDGNLAFLPDMTLAPAYDMLPMMYAPQPGVELVECNYLPPLPLPDERLLWMQAAKAAKIFWCRAANDARISTTFRKICEENAKKLGNAIHTQR